MASPRKGSTSGFMTPQASGEDLRTASVLVRRRRATTVSRPSQLADQQNSASPERATSASNSPVVAAPASAAKASSSTLAPPGPGGQPPIGTIGRRRALTISQRLRTDEQSTAPVVDQLAADQVGRQRSNTIASTGSRTRRLRAGSTSQSPAVAANAQFNAVDTHDQDEVDLLEVLDQRVSTTAALSNITSAFWPSFLTAPPIVELDPPSPDTPEREGSFTSFAEGQDQADSTVVSMVADEDLDWDALDDDDDLAPHLKKLLKKRKRSQKLRAAGLGMWTFLKTPLGVAAAIYGLLVVVWGAGLVLLLIVPMGSYARKLWVEIASQVLTGLFCVTSLLPLPWRLMDAYQVSIIYSYARRTKERRAKLGLPPLRDPNDLPEPQDAEYWVGPGGERLTGPREQPTVAPKKDKTKADSKAPTLAGTPAAQPTNEIELGAIESKVGNSPTSTTDEVEEVPVLTDEEEERLRRAQLKFGRSQTWYRAHSSPTHHAFPIGQALLISLFTLLNSVWQCFLCGCMWGLNRFNRPAWTTGCLIPLSFGCGIAAAVLIWRCGEMTKKKAEVSRKVWHMLQRDEAALQERKKAATEARQAAKQEKKNHKRMSTHPSTALGTISPSSSGAITPSESLRGLNPSFNVIRPSMDESRPSFEAAT